MPVGARGPHPLDMLGASPPGQAQWPSTLGRVRPWLVQYLAWDGQTARQAVVVLPAAWSPSTPPPAAVPLLISPHGRNNFGWNNAVIYWQELPADGQFALICPDGLERAHDPESDPFDEPPSSPSLFTYGYPGHVDDLARMPSIVEETLPWLPIDMERIYVLGSSMGGQETLLDKPFSFDSQVTYDVSAVVNPGDSLFTTCSDDNTTAGAIGFGPSTTQEMCYDFLYAYPAHALDHPPSGMIISSAAVNLCTDN